MTNHIVLAIVLDDKHKVAIGCKLAEGADFVSDFRVRQRSLVDRHLAIGFTRVLMRNLTLALGRVKARPLLTRLKREAEGSASAILDVCIVGCGGIEIVADGGPCGDVLLRDEVNLIADARRVDTSNLEIDVRKRNREDDCIYFDVFLHVATSYRLSRNSSIVKADGDGLVSHDVGVEETVVFLLLIVIQPAVILFRL